MDERIVDEALCEFHYKRYIGDYTTRESLRAALEMVVPMIRSAALREAAALCQMMIPTGYVLAPEENAHAGALTTAANAILDLAKLQPTPKGE